MKIYVTHKRFQLPKPLIAVCGQKAELARIRWRWDEVTCKKCLATRHKDFTK